MSEDKQIDKQGGSGAPLEAQAADIEQQLHHHTELPQTRISLVLDSVLVGIGKLASWLWLVTLVLIIWAVTNRYFFSSGSIALDEMQWHMVGCAWLLGLAYTLCVDEHVRVDVLHERFSLRKQGWIEFLGITLLLLPFLAVALYESIPFAHDAYRTGERSVAPAGLPNRWIVKSVLAISLVLLITASVSRLLRVCALLFGHPRPVPAVRRNDL